MEMGEQYGLPDLRHLMGGRTDFPAVAQAAEQLSGHRDLTAQQHYDMMMGGRPVVGEVLPRGVVEFRSDSTTTSSAAALCGLEMEGCIGGDGGNGRWPRQETLTLLEIRSRLDPKFKEANQKGPLWDEISRIMADEHGYQRSGKKCREKFENLYKYYKKTKEGKAGRQDGKHYRFFRQLEALYGEPSNLMSVSQTHFTGNSLLFQSTNNTSQANQEAPQAHQKLCESLSLSSSSEFDTSSSEKDSAEMMKLKMKDSQSFKRGRKSWKAKIRDFVDSQMKKLMEIQETWLEKMLKTLEQKEQERMSREEEWKKQEAARLDREQKFWANERAWVEARDAALMEALQKFSGREVKASSSEELMATDLHENSETHIENESETLESTMNNSNRWLDPEISSLVNLRTNMESRFQKCGGSEGVLWEEISAKMVCLGYNQRAKSCKDKWENINNWIRNSKGCNKKRKENSRSCTYFQHLDSPYNQRRAYCGHEIDEQGPEKVGSHPNDAPSPSNSNAGTTVQESCFRYLMGEGGSMWENYGFELNKGENQ